MVLTYGSRVQVQLAPCSTGELGEVQAKCLIMSACLAARPTCCPAPACRPSFSSPASSTAETDGASPPACLYTCAGSETNCSVTSATGLVDDSPLTKAVLTVACANNLTTCLPCTIPRLQQGQCLPGR